MPPKLNDTWRKHFHDTMAGHVERQQMPGLVGLVALGTKDFGATQPLERDDIFRIASLTKPVVAVVALMFVDDGTLRLDQAVDDLLPELADRHVLRTLESNLDDTVPAKRSITVEDL